MTKLSELSSPCSLRLRRYRRKGCRKGAGIALAKVLPGIFGRGGRKWTWTRDGRLEFIRGGIRAWRRLSGEFRALAVYFRGRSAGRGASRGSRGASFEAAPPVTHSLRAAREDPARTARQGRRERKGPAPPPEKRVAKICRCAEYFRNLQAV